MKLKTAINALLSDAGTSVASKVEVVSFLRRYASATRPCTHYSCRGRSTEAIVRLLEAMGMKKDEDFKVAESKLDPEFNQIRWLRPEAIGEMTGELVTACTNAPKLFNDLYVRVVGKKPVDDMVERFADKSEEAPAAGGGETFRNSWASERFAIRTLNRTVEIANSVLALAKSYNEAGGAGSDMQKSMPPNFDIAIRSAEEFLSRYFGEDGSVKSMDAPYILPLSVLELYVRAVRNCSVTFIDGEPDKPAPLLFKTSEAGIDLVRLIRAHEPIVWVMNLNAPLDYIWNCPKTGNGEENPLHGYFFRDVRSVLNANLDNKIGVFVGGNAAMIHDEKADNNVSVAACLFNHGKFWSYILDLYKAAYSCHAGMSCQARIGLPVDGNMWANRMPSSAAVSADNMKAWESMHHDRFSAATCPPLAEYAVVLSDFQVDGAFRNPAGFMRSCGGMKLTRPDGTMSKPDFAKSYLRKEELAWEWFAMTHLDHMAGTLGRGTVQYNSTIKEEVEVKLTDNLSRFRAKIAAADKAEMARMSECNAGSCFYSGYGGSGRPEYTPLSAMFDGVTAVLRSMWTRGAGVRGNPFPTVAKRTGSPRSTNVLVTNVYSGMCTDKSPVIGSEEDTGAVFPNMSFTPTSVPGVGSALHCSNAYRAAVTRFLDRLEAGSMEQVNMAKRSDGTKRTAVMLFETNIDSRQFLEGVDTSKLEIALGTLFLQTILYGRANPACALDDDALSETAGYGDAGYATAVHQLIRDYVHLLFGGGRWPSVPSGVYCPTNATFAKYMNVSTTCDADGRLVLVFKVCGDLLTLARMTYRYACGFPLDTAYVKDQLFEAKAANDNRVFIKDGEWGDLNKANSIIAKYLYNETRDYNGEGSVTECNNGDSGPLFRVAIASVPPGSAPDRNWQTSSSSRIDSSSVLPGAFTPDDTPSNGDEDECAF